jgi:hypothetical protein
MRVWRPFCGSGKMRTSVVSDKIVVYPGIACMPRRLGVCVQAVHLLHICIQLKLEQLFVCMDEQPEVYVTDNNFLALTTCLFDHDRSRGNLLQFCLHRLHSVWPKLVARCPRNLRQLLESCANAPFSDVLVDAFSLCADPNFGGCCNARYVLL